MQKHWRTLAMKRKRDWSSCSQSLPNVIKAEVERKFWPSFGRWEDDKRTTEEIIANIQGPNYFKDREKEM